MFLSAISIDSCVIINYIIYKTFLSLLITCFHYRRNIQIKDCFEINSKQTIKMSKKDEYLKFKNFEKKVKSTFMIYAYFESILVPKDNGKQNPNESYVNKYEKNVACSYGYKLVCVDDKFSKPFKSYLDEDVVYNFISRMIEASKYYSDVMKNHFNKELVMTKKDNEDFENSTKC